MVGPTQGGDGLAGRGGEGTGAAWSGTLACGGFLSQAPPGPSAKGGDDQRSYRGRSPGGDGRAGRRLALTGCAGGGLSPRPPPPRPPAAARRRALVARTQKQFQADLDGLPGPGCGGQLLGQLVRALPGGDAGARGGQPGL